jgi:cytochrome c-type biogenesis protein CcmH
MTARLVLASAAALVLALPASAAGSRPTLAHLEHEVMCPTCHELLELSHAPVADRIRAFIRRRIAAGDSESRIKAELVDQFGPAVLASPPARGFGLLAWLLPLGGLAAAALFVAVVAARWRRGAPTGPDDDDPLPPALERLLERELAAHDG